MWNLFLDYVKIISENPFQYSLKTDICGYTLVWGYVSSNGLRFDRGGVGGGGDGLGGGGGGGVIGSGAFLYVLSIWIGNKCTILGHVNKKVWYNLTKRYICVWIYSHNSGRCLDVSSTNILMRQHHLANGLLLLSAGLIEVGTKI